MGKGDKQRPISSRSKFDEQYDKIFGDKKPERGNFIFDEKEGKLVPEDQYVKEYKNIEGPTVLFMGRGWPSKQHKIQKRQEKLLQKNPHATTLSDKKERLDKKMDEAKEQNAQNVKKIKGNSL